MNGESVKYACHRVRDFSLVHGASSNSERLSAIDILLCSIGVDDDIRKALGEEVPKISESDIGALTLGVLLAFFMMEHEREFLT